MTCKYIENICKFFQLTLWCDNLSANYLTIILILMLVQRIYIELGFSLVPQKLAFEDWKVQYNSSTVQLANISIKSFSLRSFSKSFYLYPEVFWYWVHPKLMLSAWSIKCKTLLKLLYIYIRSESIFQKYNELNANKI